MSGIEVAGLVLAVFPLMVTGLRQFTEGTSFRNHYCVYHGSQDGALTAQYTLRHVP